MYSAWGLHTLSSHKWHASRALRETSKSLWVKDTVWRVKCPHSALDGAFPAQRKPHTSTLAGLQVSSACAQLSMLIFRSWWLFLLPLVPSSLLLPPPRLSPAFTFECSAAEVYQRVNRCAPRAKACQAGRLSCGWRSPAKNPEILIQIQDMFLLPPTLLTGGCSWTHCVFGMACEGGGGKDTLRQIWQQGGLAWRIRAKRFSLQSLSITATPSSPPLLFLLLVAFLSRKAATTCLTYSFQRTLDVDGAHACFLPLLVPAFSLLLCLIVWHRGFFERATRCSTHARACRTARPTSSWIPQEPVRSQ